MQPLPLRPTRRHLPAQLCWLALATSLLFAAHAYSCVFSCTDSNWCGADSACNLATCVSISEADLMIGCCASGWRQFKRKTYYDCDAVPTTAECELIWCHTHQDFMCTGGSPSCP